MEKIIYKRNNIYLKPLEMVKRAIRKKKKNVCKKTGRNLEIKSVQLETRKVSPSALSAQ
jgi:hypothetical protein